jgi:AraC-like DNA-binding protein
MEDDRLADNILVRSNDDAPALSGSAVSPPRVLRAEGCVIENWVFGRGRATPLTASGRTVLLAVPLYGRVKATAEGFAETAGPGAAILLARPQTVGMVWAPGSAGAILSLPRQRLQAQASRLFATPLRLAPVNIKLEGLDGEGGLIEILQTIWSRSPRPADEDADGQFVRRLATVVVQAIGSKASSGISPGELTPARSVQRTIDHVRARVPEDLGIDRLATAAGTTERTLRENFRAVLGQSVQAFVMEARLRWAHDRLTSVQDHRSIEAFAAAIGFKSSGSFARAYQRLFGETPSLTRARAVRAAGKP